MEERAVPPRRPKRWVWFLLSAVLLVFVAALGFDRMKRAEYQRKAEATQWRWPKERATLDYCVKHNLHGYSARVTPHADWQLSGRLQISILDGAEEVLAINGLPGTVFVQADDVLYYEAEFSPTEPGTALIAHDLKARKELWRCWLKSNSPDLYSSYWYSINLEVDGDAILVLVAASYGRCVEYVDRKNGRTVGYKKHQPGASLSD
jgi:hypothetical protein